MTLKIQTSFCLPVKYKSNPATTAWKFSQAITIEFRLNSVPEEMNASSSSCASSINPGSGPASSGCCRRRLCPGSRPGRPPTACDAAAALPLGLQPSAAARMENNKSVFKGNSSRETSGGIFRCAFQALRTCSLAGNTRRYSFTFILRTLSSNLCLIMHSYIQYHLSALIRVEFRHHHTELGDEAPCKCAYYYN